MSDFCEHLFIVHIKHKAVKDAFGKPKTGIMPHSIEYHLNHKGDIDYDPCKFSVIPKFHWPIHKDNKLIGVIYNQDGKTNSILLLQIVFNGRTVDTIFDANNDIFDEIMGRLIKYDKHAMIEMLTVGKPYNMYNYNPG